jgi:hypothetical protein
MIVLKTMWNMPATVVREFAANDEDASEPVASGSLKEMVQSFDGYDDTEAAGLIIRCAGRDRPITWSEIRDLRRAGNTTAAT